jgi:hypothetical protein
MRIAAFMLAVLAAGCAAPASDLEQGETDPGSTTTSTTTVAVQVPDPPREPYRVEREFTDSLGRKPVNLRVRPGRSAVVTFVDSASVARPIPEQRESALLVARRLWNQIGRNEQVDTVAVTFTSHAELSDQKKDVEFFFYPQELGGPR